MTDDLCWNRSSRCAANACVEVALEPERAWMRDGKDLGGPVLQFEPAQWNAFVQGVRADAFDLTTGR